MASKDRLTLKEAREQGRLADFSRQHDDLTPDSDVKNQRRRFANVLEAMAKGAPVKSSGEDDPA